MLGKLLSYEWKDSWAVMLVLNLVVIVMSIFGAFGIDALKEQDFSIVNSFYSAIYVTIYAAGLFTLAIVTSIYFYIRFYKNLYTDQGYLMHTLPVSSHELIASKLIIAAMWRVISYITIGVGLLIIFHEEFGWNDIVGVIDDVLESERPLYAITALVLLILIGLGYVLYSLLMGYAAISIGQMAKNKVWGAIGAFVGLRILVRFFRGALSVILMRTHINSRIIGPSFIYGYMPGLADLDSDNILVVLLCSVIVVYSVCIVFYAISNYMMKYRLNLE